MTPQRIPLRDFPDVVLHAEEASVKHHPEFAAAKAGDIVAAGAVVAEFINPDAVERLRTVVDRQRAVLLPVHALEVGGVNEIPVALARELGRRLGLPVSTSVVQSNAVGHTGADGFHRLANQALFEGVVTRGARYLIVDDFVGQGGTLANLIGFVFSAGGAAVGATTLTGKAFSAKLAPAEGQIQALRDRHGRALEQWWIEGFGFDFDRLTRSEARYLAKTADALTVRDRIAAARLERGS
jgi:hypoxanthine-guanine phosphoribosyltransferase